MGCGCMRGNTVNTYLFLCNEGAAPFSINLVIKGVESHKGTGICETDDFYGIQAEILASVERDCDLDNKQTY